MKIHAPFWPIGSVIGIICGVFWARLWTLDEEYLIWGGFWLFIHWSSGIAACWQGQTGGKFSIILQISGYACLGAAAGAVVVIIPSLSGGEWDGIFMVFAPIGALFGLILGGGIGFGLHKANFSLLTRIEPILIGSVQAACIGCVAGAFGIIVLTMIGGDPFTLSLSFEGLFLSSFFALLLAIPAWITGGLTSIVIHVFRWKRRGV